MSLQAWLLKNLTAKSNWTVLDGVVLNSGETCDACVVAGIVLISGYF